MENKLKKTRRLQKLPQTFKRSQYFQFIFFSQNKFTKKGKNLEYFHHLRNFKHKMISLTFKVALIESFSSARFNMR